MFNIHSFEASSEKYANFSQLFFFAFRKWNENKEEKFSFLEIYLTTQTCIPVFIVLSSTFTLFYGGKKDKDRDKES